MLGFGIVSKHWPLFILNQLEQVLSNMNIYVVKNERDEEVAAYTDAQHAKQVAAEFELVTVQRYHVEMLACETDAEPEEIPIV